MMKKVLAGIIALSMLVSVPSLSYAGDDEWADAGKVLAILEGLRVVSGGRVDPVGTIGGVKNDGYRNNDKVVHRSVRTTYPDNRYKTRKKFHKYHDRGYHQHNELCYNRVWVPRYVWEEEYIPGHEVYDEEIGTMVFVEGHYVRYKVEKGGYWKKQKTFQCRS